MAIDSQLSEEWHRHLIENKYSYNFTWLGVPIVQEPQDIVLVQELIWKVKPDLIIETGIAHGGSLVMSASMMELLNVKYPADRRVIGIDIDIRDETSTVLAEHPMRKYMTLLQGSSVDPFIVSRVRKIASEYKCIMLMLDSDHTHDHVLAELHAYANLVTSGSYCVVFDTGIDGLPEGLLFGRRWGKGNNPKTAVHQFLKEDSHFSIDKEIESRLGIVTNPDGWLKHD